MRRQNCFETILVGKVSLLKAGLAEILRSANFRILASVSCADDLPNPEVQPCQQLFLIVHVGDDFEFSVRQIELIRSRHPGGRVAIVADRYRLDELVSAFRVGVNGYFADITTSDVLIMSLELVMMGETVLPSAFLSYALGPEGGQLGDDRPGEDDNKAILVTENDAMEPRLSPREKLILRCLVEGDSNKSIARKLNIAEATVKVHVKALFRKIRVHNRTQAAIWGMNNGWQPRTTGAITPPLSLGMMGPNSEIEQNDEPICSAVIDHANCAEVRRLEHRTRKDANFIAYSERFSDFLSRGIREMKIRVGEKGPVMTARIAD